MAAGCKDRLVRILSAATEAEVLAIKGHKKAVNAGAFSPDDKLLAAGGDDGIIRVWKAE